MTLVFFLDAREEGFCIECSFALGEIDRLLFP